MNRRNVSKVIFGGVAALACLPYVASRAFASPLKTIFWIDIDVPQARGTFARISSNLVDDGSASLHGYRFEPLFVRNSDETWDSDVRAAVQPLLGIEGATFVCMWHHSAKVIRENGSWAPMVLLSVLDPVGLGLIGEGSNQDKTTLALTFDVPNSWLPLDLLMELEPSSSTVGIVAAREWWTKRREEQVTVAAEIRGVTVVKVFAESWQMFETQGVDQVLSQSNCWWVPESIFLYDNRQRVVDVLVAKRKAHVLGRIKSAHLGGLFAVEARLDNWQDRLESLIRFGLATDFRRNVPLIYPDDIVVAANLKTLESYALNLPDSVLSRVDRFV